MHFSHSLFAPKWGRKSRIGAGTDVTLKLPGLPVPEYPEGYLVIVGDLGRSWNILGEGHYGRYWVTMGDLGDIGLLWDRVRKLSEERNEEDTVTRIDPQSVLA
jgi:hypothetical protein